MSRLAIHGWCLLWLMMVAAPGRLWAQAFDFAAPASVDDPVVAERMRDLAERILPVYQEKDTERYLVNLAALQLVAGNPSAASESRRSLQERRQTGAPRPVVPYVMLHDLIVRARAIEAAEHVPFADAFAREFRKEVPALADRDAHALTRLMLSSPTATREALQAAFDRVRPRGRLEQTEAMELVWMYLWFDAYRRTGGAAPALVVQEDTRRYLSDQEVVIKSRRGIELAIRVVRPRHPQGRPLPAVLEFTIDPSRDEAHESAAHGYVGVVAYTRGKKRRDGRIIPFEHERRDVRAVIEWIAQQPWSDGRVAMIGQGYSGFAAWAVLKDPPAALKAVVTSDAMAPGIDFPMEGNVMRNASLRWASEHTQGLREADGKDDEQADARWRALDLEWFRSGRPYRDLDRIAREPNRVFRRWIGHPSYDRYWQKMIPQTREFAKVKIPVLTITGYYAQGAVGAMHYFTEHARKAPDASHVLLAGPWDERAVENRPARMLRGLATEPGARVDLAELRFDWIDHVLGGAPRPPLLGDRVNLWMPGPGGDWRHAPDLAALAGGSPLRLHLETGLDEGTGAGERKLLDAAPADRRDASFEQRVDRKDRKDAGDDAMTPIVSRDLPLRHAVQYVSEPLTQPTEVAGLMSGQLDFRPSRMDLDLQVTLYERLATGEQVMLGDPYEFRASYARDRTSRRLLKAGVRQKLAFRSQQLMARRLQAGSRLVLVIGVIQQADRQINYGLGDDVNAESLQRAGGKPLRIRWYPGSWIDVPVRR
ncbi:MAG: peptidase [Panacagrimonas sp.]|nr:CocE/NonD family hydrolase [Panacagrimonas sp.]MCC2659069.1 peptidase [Panacagrimonas sp.]